MSFLKQLGFTGRFKTLRIGFIVDKSKISPCIHGMINDLVAKDVDFLILDIHKIYMVDEGYFDLVITDYLVGEIYEIIHTWVFLISGGGLLLQMINNVEKKYHSVLPLESRGVVFFSSNFDQITYKGLIYQNDDY